MAILGRYKVPRPARLQTSDDGEEPGASTNPRQSIAFAAMAALCGFVLLVLPYLWDNLSVGLRPFRWYILVVGLAAIAAALGSQAVAKNKLFSAGGMAAIVVIFASIFTPPRASFVYGNIRGTEKFQSAVMMASSSFLIGRHADNGVFHFFALEDELKGPIFYINVRNIDGDLPQQIIIGCIPIDLLRKHVGDSDGLDLTMIKNGQDPNNPHWTLVQTQKTEPLGHWGNPDCTAEDRPALKAASLPSRLGNALLPSAYAMPAQQQAPPTPPLNLPGDVTLIYRELAQGDFAAEIRAQDRVARLRDERSISAVVKEWRAPWKNKVDTGLMVAWVHGSRLDAAVAVAIAKAMSKEQLEHIVELAGSRDYTVRYNATELLSWLLRSTGGRAAATSEAQADVILTAVLRPFTDTQAFFEVGEKAPGDTMHDFSAYNAMIALNDAKCALRASDRTRATSALQAFAASPQVKALKLEKTSAAAGQFQNKQC